MSSRYGSETPERENVLSHAEAPLPTYEEVVGASQTHIGFKHDVLLPPRGASYAAGERDSRQLPASSAQDNNESPYEPRPKQSKKVILLIFLASLLLALCFTIIVIQLRVCSTSHPTSQETCLRCQDSLRQCIDDKSSMQERYDGYVADSETKKLQERYETVVDQKEVLDSQNRILRKTIAKLTEEKAELQKKLTDDEKYPQEISLAELLEKVAQLRNDLDSTGDKK